ncbi:hypothetical protein COE45_27705 [Bacillus thuringiensis]|nr:hypothetical protein COE45_27705 [Bacillus thuringiensis]
MSSCYYSSINRRTNREKIEGTSKKRKEEKKKGITYKERSKRLSGINVYITNLSAENVPTEHIHDLYSLRWQIEILFKTWKSFFQIDKCKEIKKELSEYKSIYMIKNYYLLFYEGLQQGIHELSKVLLRLFYLLEKNGRKSYRYKKKKFLIS